MASTGLHGPHPLDAANIDHYIGLSTGAYALGYESDKGVFVVKYVGRSDEDLNSRLKNWIGKYPSFKYGHFESPLASFDRECRMFHDFGGVQSLDNTIHPARPKGSQCRCPMGDCF